MLYLKCFETFYFHFYSDPRHLIFEKNFRKPRNVKSLALKSGNFTLGLTRSRFHFDLCFERDDTFYPKLIIY